MADSEAAAKAEEVMGAAVMEAVEKAAVAWAVAVKVAATMVEEAMGAAVTEAGARWWLRDWWRGRWRRGWRDWRRRWLNEGTATADAARLLRVDSNPNIEVAVGRRRVEVVARCRDNTGPSISVAEAEVLVWRSEVEWMAWWRWRRIGW